MKRVHQIAIKCRTYLVLTKENWAINKPRWNHHRKVILQKTSIFQKEGSTLPLELDKAMIDQGKEEQTPIHVSVN